MVPRGRREPTFCVFSIVAMQIAWKRVSCICCDVFNMMAERCFFQESVASIAASIAPAAPAAHKNDTKIGNFGTGTVYSNDAIAVAEIATETDDLNCANDANDANDATEFAFSTATPCGVSTASTRTHSYALIQVASVLFRVIDELTLIKFWPMKPQYPSHKVQNLCNSTACADKNGGCGNRKKSHHHHHHHYHHDDHCHRNSNGVGGADNRGAVSCDTTSFAAAAATAATATRHAPVCNHWLKTAASDPLNVFILALELARRYVLGTEHAVTSNVHAHLCLERTTRIKLAACVSVAYKFYRSSVSRLSRVFVDIDVKTWPYKDLGQTRELAFLACMFLSDSEQRAVGSFDHRNAKRISRLYKETLCHEMYILASVNDIHTLATRNCQVLVEERLYTLMLKRLIDAQQMFQARAIVPFFLWATLCENDAGNLYDALMVLESSVYASGALCLAALACVCPSTCTKLCMSMFSAPSAPSAPSALSPELFFCMLEVDASVRLVECALQNFKNPQLLPFSERSFMAHAFLKVDRLSTAYSTVSSIASRKANNGTSAHTQH